MWFGSERCIQESAQPLCRLLVFKFLKQQYVRSKGAQNPSSNQRFFEQCAELDIPRHDSHRVIIGLQQGAGILVESDDVPEHQMVDRIQEIPSAGVESRESGSLIFEARTRAFHGEAHGGLSSFQPK